MSNLEFCTQDLTEKEYEQNCTVAAEILAGGDKPKFSTGSCGSITAGYGRCDGYGYWEFPLGVDPDTMTVSPLYLNG